MYHESVFSLRQDSSILSKKPAVSRVTLSRCLKEPLESHVERSRCHPLRWFEWLICKSLIQNPIDSFPTRHEGYGFVLGTHFCTVDPIEAGAEFHEDSLGDR